MITVVAVLRAKPGMEEALGAVLKKMAEGVKTEPGNRRYDLFRSVDDPAAFLCYEAYVDQEAIEAHRAAEHFKAGGVAMKDLLAGRPEIQRFVE